MPTRKFLEMDDPLQLEIEAMARRARAAAGALALLDEARKNSILLAIADGLEAAAAEILAANARDLEAAAAAGLPAAMLDRLRLDGGRLAAIAADTRRVAGLPDPVGRVLAEFDGAQGIRIFKTSVPIGVIGIIFESRPNVTVDAAVLCLKAGNATILRGGREALHSNLALAAVVQRAGAGAGLPDGAVQMVASTDRRAVPVLCGMDRWLDLVIPRGGHGLIEAVVASARVPVIKHYDGICHVYLDAAADPVMAETIVINAKCQRPGVCNAAETLLVHQAAAPALLPPLARALAARGVELRGDDETTRLLAGVVPVTQASEADWRTEHLALILNVRVVAGLDEAVAHINRHGSHHSDAIITADAEVARRFLAAVDSAAVYWNASTRFTDGGQFGFGAEIGISTDKLHARGPMGLAELTSYKYIVEGSGQARA
jgi:glutamate-5-semialdehyde dehydrogenase